MGTNFRPNPKKEVSLVDRCFLCQESGETMEPPYPNRCIWHKGTLGVVLACWDDLG